jgi:hypothetical protein
MANAPATHFVVERLNWRRVGEAFYRLPGETRVAAFDDADAAEAYRREQEEMARRAVNPFAGAAGGLADLTDFAEPVWCDWLTDHDVEPPQPGPEGRRDWAAWWGSASPGWSEAQRAAVWEKLDRALFFRVVERPRQAVGYAVVKVKWDYNDEWFYPGQEGGAVQKVYLRRDKAEAECTRLSAREREIWSEMFQSGNLGYEPAGLNQFDLEGRLLPGQAPFGPPPAPARAGTEVEDEDPIFTFAPNEVPFFEVVEIDLEGLR